MTVQDIIAKSVHEQLTPKQTIARLKKNGFKTNQRKRPWRDAYITYMQSKVETEAPAKVEADKSKPSSSLSVDETEKQLNLIRRVLGSDWTEKRKLEAVEFIFKNNLIEDDFERSSYIKETAQGQMLVLEVSSVLQNQKFSLQLLDWEAKAFLSCVPAIKAWLDGLF